MEKLEQVLYFTEHKIYEEVNKINGSVFAK